RGGKGLPVWAEGDRTDPLGIRLEGGDDLTCRDVPQGDRPVLAPGGEGRAVGAVGQALDGGGLPERCPLCERRTLQRGEHAEAHDNQDGGSHATHAHRPPLPSHPSSRLHGPPSSFHAQETSSLGTRRSVAENDPDGKTSPFATLLPNLPSKWFYDA